MDDSWLRFIMFIDVICCNSGPPQAFASSIPPTCESRYSSAGQGFSWKNASIASVSDHAGRLITCPTLHSNETQTGMIMMTSKSSNPDITQIAGSKSKPSSTISIPFQWNVKQKQAAATPIATATAKGAPWGLVPTMETSRAQYLCSKSRVYVDHKWLKWEI